MKNRQIINIINFIRGCEPREPVDLVRPVREQIKLMTELELSGTFLIQYDALLMPEFVTLLKDLDPEQFELGVWFEVVQPLTEAAGIPWTGRFPWDWHVHCGFSVGYTKPQRELLVDLLYEKFKATFGYYPRVFGSWFFDSHTARHVSDKYGADAFCNCKEQYGTDGYTLWGGYYGQGYYPSRKNVFFPAQGPEDRIDTPLFRMLGSDPVYQYDFGLDTNSGADKIQQVITLEPAYTSSGGGCDKWVDWFMRENFNGECLSFGYAQAGQENSFSWPRMEHGLTYQFPIFARLAREGKLTVEPIGRTGRRFKETYKDTPASVISAHTSWDDENRGSLWYNSKNYRINLYRDNYTLRIRDLHIFGNGLADPFEDTVCLSNEAAYYTLPVTDGNIHSGNGVLAGVYFLDGETGEDIRVSDYVFSETPTGAARADFGKLCFTLCEDRILIDSTRPFRLSCLFGKTDNHMPSLLSSTPTELRLSYLGTAYGLELKKGRFTSPTELVSQDNGIEIAIKTK